MNPHTRLIRFDAISARPPRSVPVFAMPAARSLYRSTATARTTPPTSRRCSTRWPRATTWCRAGGSAVSAWGVPITMTKNKTAPVVLMAALAVCVSVLAAGAQSLADVARKEAARREAVKAPAKVVTNNDLRAVTPAAPAVPSVAGEPGVEPPAAAGGVPADAAAENPPEAPDPTRSAEYWRKRISDARQARDHNAFLLEAIQSRIDALTADFSARDDPFQRAQIDQPPECDCRTRSHDKGPGGQLERKISDIEEETRRANVPPGWLR